LDAHRSFRIDEFEYLNVGGEAFMGRLYRPHGSNFPGVVDVHGGRWVTRDRFHNAGIAEYLAARGIAVFSIDFRMPPTVTYPGSLHDINFGFRWFKANAEKLGVRPNEIGGLAMSSGGHQLLLSALRPGAEPYGVHPLDADVDASVKYMVMGSPVVDPESRFKFAQETNRDDIVEAHDAYWVPLSTMADGSPQAILDSGVFPTLPPLAIVQGTADSNFDYRDVEKFAADYAAKGGEVDLRLYDGAGHSFITRYPTSEASLDALERMGDFIEAHTS
jgi:acetyl esterase